MRYPSIKTLMQLTDGDKIKAKQIREILTATRRSDITATSKAAREYESNCYNPPDFYLLKLYAIDELLGGFGIEAIDIPEGSFNNCQTPKICIEYVNFGDPYITTLCRVTSDYGRKLSYRVIGWGDIVERYN